jgi:hypothetical protein
VVLTIGQALTVWARFDHRETGGTLLPSPSHVQKAWLAL